VMCALCKDEKCFGLQTLQIPGVICICSAADLYVTMSSCFIHQTEASAAVFADFCAIITSVRLPSTSTLFDNTAAHYYYYY
jgi:hypothetical protein